MPDVRVRFMFSGLPIEELRTYRHLRETGLDRFLTNIAMYGRWTVHRHGTCDITGKVVDEPEFNGRDCPYFARYFELPGHDPEAMCAFECDSEPACVTGQPTDGWPEGGPDDAT